MRRTIRAARTDADLHVTLIPLERIAIRTLFSVCSVLVKKDCLQLGGFDVSLKSVEDRDMWVRIASQHRIGLLDRTCWYRQTPGMSNNVPEHGVLIATGERVATFPILCRDKALEKSRIFPMRPNSTNVTLREVLRM